MDEAMMREAAMALAARLNALLNASMASDIVLSREEVLLALGFTESVVELLAPKR
jgi:hypothetical protein